MIPPAQMKETIKLVSNERIQICRDCEFHSSKHASIRIDEHCTDCGCPLSAKTKCMSCDCPKSFWKAHVTDDENEELRKL